MQNLKDKAGICTFDEIDKIVTAKQVVIYLGPNNGDGVWLPVRHLKSLRYTDCTGQSVEKRRLESIWSNIMTDVT